MARTRRAAKFAGVLQFAVGVAQGDHFLDAEGLRRVQLLLMADFGEALRGHVGVVGALAAVGAEHVIGVGALTYPVGDEAAAGNLGVVGMGGNHQYGAGNLYHGQPP